MRWTFGCWLIKYEFYTKKSMKKVMESGNKILPLHCQVEIKNNRE